MSAQKLARLPQGGPARAKKATTYAERVKGFTYLDAARVEAARLNHRTHGDEQRKSFREIAASVGVAGALLVWVPDDAARAALRAVRAGDVGAFAAWLDAYRGRVRLIDGHMRREELRQRQPVLVLDVDEREADVVLATYDAVGAQAGRDEALLRELLATVDAPDVSLIDDLRALVSAQAPETASDETVEASAPAAVANVEALRAPFPWFGGKSRAASLIWGALGDVPNYVEPFAGSLACLLARPGGAGRIETVNDLDAWIANFWRAVAADPEAVARYADWPVNEADLHARHRWLLSRDEWRHAMHADPERFDARIAGWWVWGCCAWIGSGWCVAPSAQIPHLATGGSGVHAAAAQSIVATMRALSDRLRRVRVACGDWRRVLTPAVTTGHGLTGVLLDPPYAAGADNVYREHDKSVSADVRAWALEHGRDEHMRIVLCGYEGEHARFPSGWRCVAWKAKGGYGAQATERTGNEYLERLWLSPGCLAPEGGS